MSLLSRIISISSEGQKSFLSERQVYMGLAILLVVTNHTTFRFHIPVLGHIFHYISGVDIFMFFSGLGLCFSCTKNSLSQFYKNRFLRILPLYLVLAIVSSLTYQIAEGNLTIWDWFCNLTTLSYYGLGGGCFVDWYLSSLFIFYLLFPLVFKNIKSNVGILFICLASEVIVLLVPMYWTYDCFVSRIGAFLLGVLFYRSREDNLFFVKGIIASLLLCIGFSVTAHIIDHTLSNFLFKSFFMPPLIFLFSIVISKKCMAYIKSIIGYLGKHSLEIYVANCISWSVGSLLPSEVYFICTDILLTATFAVLLFYINTWCMDMLRKSKINI